MYSVVIYLDSLYVALRSAAISACSSESVGFLLSIRSLYLLKAIYCVLSLRLRSVFSHAFLNPRLPQLVYWCRGAAFKMFSLSGETSAREKGKRIELPNRRIASPIWALLSSEACETRRLSGETNRCGLPYIPSYQRSNEQFSQLLREPLSSSFGPVLPASTR